MRRAPMDEESAARVLTGHSNDINDCDFSVDGLLASCSSDKYVRVWSCTAAECSDIRELAYSPLTYHTYSVRCVRFSPSGSHLLTCSTDGTAVLWSSKTGVISATLRHTSSAPLRACCFSPDGSMLATAGDDALICIWSADDTSLLHVLKEHEETVTSVTFSGDGRLLASGSTLGDMRVWFPRQHRPGAGAAAVVEAAHDLGVTGCHFMPEINNDSHVLASCGNDSAVRLWRVDAVAAASSVSITSLRCLWAHTGTAMMVRFSAHSRFLASAAGDKSVIVWNTSDWSVHRTFSGHQRYVTSCCFSRDGRLLASGSNDRTVRVLTLVSAAASTADKLPAPASSSTAATATASYRQRQVGTWSCVEVCDWLRSLGLAQYTDSFTRYNIDGPALLQLTEQQLTEQMAVELIGHRNKLVRQLERARAGQLASASKPPYDEFYCPITREIMSDPVVCSDGYSYEKSAITSWLEQHTSSPMTNEPMTEVLVIPNHALRSLICHWRDGRNQL